MDWKLSYKTNDVRIYEPASLDNMRGLKVRIIKCIIRQTGCVAQDYSHFIVNTKFPGWIDVSIVADTMRAAKKSVENFLDLWDGDKRTLHITASTVKTHLLWKSNRLWLKWTGELVKENDPDLVPIYIQAGGRSMENRDELEHFIIDYLKLGPETVSALVDKAIAEKRVTQVGDSILLNRPLVGES